MNLRHTACLLTIICSLWSFEQAAAQDWIYRTQRGDTLWDLCLEYTARRGCWQELGKYNAIANDRVMQPGTELRIPVGWLLEVPLVGKVLHVRGEVSYQAYHGSTPVPLVAGQDLMLGSLLVSRAGSATIVLGGHNQLLLRPNSVLEISTMSVGEGPGQASELHLNQGEVEVQVQPGRRSRFEVQTPSAIAAVRGTEYRVVSLRQEQSTRSEVLKGLVAIQAGSSADVPEGFGLKASAGAALGEPRKLLAPPMFEPETIKAPLPVTVRWSNDPGAVAWFVDVYSTGDKGELLASYRPTEPELVFDSLDEGCYRLVARGIDAEGFNGLEQALPLCVVPAPEEPRTYWDLLLWCITAAVMLI